MSGGKNITQWLCRIFITNDGAHYSCTNIFEVTDSNEQIYSFDGKDKICNIYFSLMQLLEWNAEHAHHLFQHWTI